MKKNKRRIQPSRVTYYAKIKNTPRIDAMPTPASFGWIDLKDLMSPPRNLDPRQTSVTITGRPTVNKMKRYGAMKDPPPYLVTRLGKRHTFPSPTALPTVAQMNAKRECHVS